MELFKNFKDLWRGVALALVISVPAWLLGKQFEVIGGPVFASSAWRSAWCFAAAPT